MINNARQLLPDLLPGLQNGGVRNCVEKRVRFMFWRFLNKSVFLFDFRVISYFAWVEHCLHGRLYFSSAGHAVPFMNCT